MNEFYKQLNDKAAGHNVLITLRLSDATELLDSSYLPIEVRRQIANDIEKQLGKDSAQAQTPGDHL